MAKWWFTFVVGASKRCALGQKGPHVGRCGPFGGTHVLRSVLGGPQSPKHESWEKT